MKRTILILGALALLLGGVGQAKAGIIQIDEPTPDSGTTWTVTFAGLPPGPGLNGVFFATGTIDADGSEHLSFKYEANTNSTITQTLLGAIYDDAAKTIIGDLVTVQTTAGSDIVQVDVVSDGSNPINLSFKVGGVVENGLFQDLIVTPNAAGSDTISLRSDPLVDAAVPEPATLTLLGFGIAGLAGYGWRRRKQQVANA